jgi:hypothetical protein
VTWITLSAAHLSDARQRLRHLGYVRAIDLVKPSDHTHRSAIAVQTRWKGKDVSLLRIYEEDDSLFRERAPDRRTFLLECGDGVVRPIIGYRGGRSPLEHRALPVVDARLLVNLVWQPTRGTFLDPFAGAGGVILEATSVGWTTMSLDVDPALRFGLARQGTHHVVGTATALPLQSRSIDAVASEPPYHSTAARTVLATIPEMARVLRPNGRLALLVSSHQVEAICSVAQDSRLSLKLSVPIDRKGTAVHCLYWTN